MPTDLLALLNTRRAALVKRAQATNLPLRAKYEAVVVACDVAIAKAVQA